jgi:phosphatidylinositol alpha-mannosyltransferase
VKGQADPVRILITNPFCRPFVRRGAETILDELCEQLSRRNYKVAMLTSKPGKRHELRNGNIQVFQFGQPGFWPFRNGRALQIIFAVRCFFFLIRNRFDLVHCLHYSDVCAARAAGWLTKRRYIYHMMGIPVRRAYLRRPVDLAMLTMAVGGARRNLLLSRFAGAVLAEDFGIAGEVIEGPCDLKRFTPGAGRAVESPVFLAVGAFCEPRKGLRVLLRAFRIVKRQVPGASLEISGSLWQKDDRLDEVPAEIRSSIRLLGTGSLSDLPELYRRASVTVLPSMWEALGLVLIESLASGTPVVGTRHSGITEVVAEGVGALFDPGTDGSEAVNEEGLAQAMLGALALHADPHLGERCRAAAQRFSWESVIPRIERVHEMCVSPERADSR